MYTCAQCRKFPRHCRSRGSNIAVDIALRLILKVGDLPGYVTAVKKGVTVVTERSSDAIRN